MSRLLKLGMLAVILIPGANPLRAASVELRGAHPYLYYTTDQVAALKQRIATERSSEAAWNNLLEKANRTLEQNNAGASSLELLGLAYRMTGERRFAEKMRQILLAECGKSTWTDRELMKRDPPWQSHLGMAHTCYGMAVGFDCAYDALSPEDRQTIARGIVELGIMPSLNDWVLGQKRIHSLDSMGHNWWSACVFMAGVASLAVMNEEPRAAEWLERISEGSVEWFGYAGSVLETKPANFDRDGAFYESVNYASFGMSQYLFFRLAWLNAVQSPKPPDLPILDRAADHFIHASYPNSSRLMMVNFGDGSLHSDGSRPITLLHACGIRPPRGLWYLNQVGQQTYREGLDRSTPFGLAFYPNDSDLALAPAAPDLPPSSLFKDMGWAMLRSSWDKDATLLAVKSGMTWNHAHADAGSFILMHRGKNLLIDSGNCSYTRPEYDAYYRQSEAHNVVLFDGKGENPEDAYHGSQLPGAVHNLLDAGDLKYVWADATGPMSQRFIRNFRHFLWIGDVILVIDDLKTYDLGQFEWLLHVDGTAERRGLDLSIAQDNARVVVRPLFPDTFPDQGFPHDFPEKMKLIEKIGLKDHEPQTKVTYFAIAPAGKSRQTKFITALILNPEQPPQIERLEAKNMIGVRIRQNGATTDVYLNLLADGRLRHLNSNLIVNGWGTDAYLLAVTFPDGADISDPDSASRYFMAQGSYLRRDGKLVFDSLSKVFATWSQGAGAMEVLLQGQPVINARIRSLRQPAGVRVNNRAMDTTYDRAGQRVVLRITEEDQP